LRPTVAVAENVPAVPWGVKGCRKAISQGRLRIARRPRPGGL